ncbi:MAG: hypothetical protein H0T73_09030 [Ardenticatenales bacterium]|nr:hypothetical protein [Ardenticatenales bacterium]
MIILGIPLHQWWNKFFFRLNNHTFQAVVVMVESGEIQPDENHIAQLPPPYEYLSRCGGEIMIDQSNGITRVFFYTYRDMFDDFAGYLYRSDFNPPQKNDFEERTNRLRSWSWFEQLRPYWYFCTNV